MGFIIGAAVILILGGGIAAMLIMTVPISKMVYREQLVRTSPDKWGRVCSAPENEEQMAMWEKGIAWAQENSDSIREVSIENDGLTLYGELFDFGSDRCAVILPGRCECLKYSYFYAAPYKAAGFNVLVIDTRAHGKSGGMYNTIGVKESGDLLAWVDMLERDFGIKEVYFHGICIGSAVGMLAITDKRCSEAVKGMVADGAFVSFRETFKRHMIADKRPLIPVLDLVMLQIRLHTGTNVLKSSPMRAVRKIDKRMLFLFGEKDIFSVPEKSKKLFAACKSPDKSIVWFEKGGHSHLRINMPEKYDNAVVEFLKK